MEIWLKMCMKGMSMLEGVVNYFRETIDDDYAIW